MGEFVNFVNRLLGRQGSGATAKERLRLVLMSDHLSLAPDLIEQMKRELIDVVSRFVEVDRENIDVHFEHQDSTLAMLASIPITGVNRNAGQLEESPQTPATAFANGPRRRRRRKKQGTVVVSTATNGPGAPSAAT